MITRERTDTKLVYSTNPRKLKTIKEGPKNKRKKQKKLANELDMRDSTLDVHDDSV